MQKKIDGATLARRAYQRAWRKANPDRVRAYNTAYWKRQAEKLKEAQQNDTESNSAD